VSGQGAPAVLFVRVLWTVVANVHRRALLADSLPRDRYATEVLGALFGEEW
jgi:hypothetical protein